MNKLITFCAIANLCSLTSSLIVTFKIDWSALKREPTVLRPGGVGRFRVKLANWLYDEWIFSSIAVGETDSNDRVALDLPLEWEKLFATRKTDERFVLAVKVEMADAALDPIPFALFTGGQRVTIELEERNGKIIGNCDERYQLIWHRNRNKWMKPKKEKKMGQTSDSAIPIKTRGKDTQKEGSENETNISEDGDAGNRITKRRKQEQHFQLNSYGQHFNEQQMNFSRATAALMPTPHFGSIQSGPAMPMPNLPIHSQILPPFHPAFYPHSMERFASQAKQFKNWHKLLMVQRMVGQKENKHFHREGDNPQNLPINADEAKDPAGQHAKRHGKEEMTKMDKNNPEYWHQMQAKLMESAMNPGQMGHQNFGKNTNLATGNAGQQSSEKAKKFYPHSLYAIQRMAGLANAKLGNVQFWSEEIPNQSPQINQLDSLQETNIMAQNVQDSKGKQLESLHEEIVQKPLDQVNPMQTLQADIMPSNTGESYKENQNFVEMESRQKNLREPIKEAKTPSSSSTASDARYLPSYGSAINAAASSLVTHFPHFGNDEEEDDLSNIFTFDREDKPRNIEQILSESSYSQSEKSEMEGERNSSG